ncbi:protein TIC 21, chloroplastic [Nicotiana tabacum]|uniref:Protein TIC 21, chloroplastic n=1 Tax=Nicotiana tabacum TaxID=4097 RepID=A0A1S3ZR21_TOBAC|nr:protein TIC 21, chloroplastic [Nicotiana tomentosiformis]XP_016466754.1 PREDICTED: protein TIC 21, chloroplastic-like [Nicotiana tabacum]
MQTLLLPAAHSVTGSAPSALSSAGKPCRHNFFGRQITLISSPSSLSLPPLKTKPLSFPQFSLINKRTRILASAPLSPPYTSPNDESEKAKLAQVAKRLQNTARYFKRLGSLGFWGQLVCTLVAAVILSFSVVVTGKITSPFTFYSTAGGIAAAFVSVFWSFGYIRLSEKLRRTANDPSKAPPRADVVKSLKNGIVVNLLGMGAAVLGMQATVGSLVAKALTTSANPYSITPGSSPVLALDVFLVQASANTIVAHFLGLVFSLELLRSVTLPPSEGIPVPRVA